MAAALAWLFVGSCSPSVATDTTRGTVRNLFLEWWAMPRPSHRELMRNLEFERVWAWIRGDTVVEIGGGAGWQAKRFAALGKSIRSFDLDSSEYARVRVYPVETFDGRHIPVDDGWASTVFSSHVLEHVDERAVLFDEMARILGEDGIAVHVVPTTTWRAATIASKYASLPAAAARRLVGAGSIGEPPTGPAQARSSLREMSVASLLRTSPHGVRARSAWPELAEFRPRMWERLFSMHGWTVTDAAPLGLLYSGVHLWGHRIPVDARNRAARLLGSSSYAFVMRPPSRRKGRPPDERPT